MARRAEHCSPLVEHTSVHNVNRQFLQLTSHMQPPWTIKCTCLGLVACSRCMPTALTEQHHHSTASSHTLVRCPRKGGRSICSAAAHLWRVQTVSCAFQQSLLHFSIYVRD